MAEVQYANSWVEIANRALGRIGKGRIDNLTSGDDLVQYVNTFMGEAVESVLSARAWTLSVRLQLARRTSVPVYGYQYSYALPVDLVNLVSVLTDGDYKAESDTILTDSETVYIVYVPRPTDPSILPGYLKKAISTHLALLLTTPLTSSDAMAARIAQEAAMSLQEAVNADARRAQPAATEGWYEEAR